MSKKTFLMTYQDGARQQLHLIDGESAKEAVRAALVGWWRPEDRLEFPTVTVYELGKPAEVSTKA